MNAVANFARIDWFRVIVQIERQGWSLERIAIEMERSKGWISNLKNLPGTEPRYHDGWMLIALWARVTECKAVDVPRCSE